MVDFEDYNHPNDTYYFELEGREPYCTYCNAKIERRDLVRRENEYFHLGCFEDHLRAFLDDTEAYYEGRPFTGTTVVEILDHISKYSRSARNYYNFLVDLDDEDFDRQIELLKKAGPISVDTIIETYHIIF